jgi:hypothetical protein
MDKETMPAPKSEPAVRQANEPPVAPEQTTEEIKSTEVETPLAPGTVSSEPRTTPEIHKQLSEAGNTVIVPTDVKLEDGSIPKPYYFDDNGFLRHFQTDTTVDMDSAIKGDLGPQASRSVL